MTIKLQNLFNFRPQYILGLTVYHYWCQVRGGTGRSGPELSGVTLKWKGFDNKVEEQPWPQLVHYASIRCRVCSCVFQED